MTTIYEQAVEKWGVKSQIDMAIEECSELITVLRHFDRGKATMSQVCTEVADVEIMMSQLRVILSGPVVESCKLEKLTRLKDLVKTDCPVEVLDDDQTRELLRDRVPVCTCGKIYATPCGNTSANAIFQFLPEDLSSDIILKHTPPEHDPDARLKMNWTVFYDDASEKLLKENTSRLHDAKVAP